MRSDYYFTWLNYSDEIHHAMQVYKNAKKSTPHDNWNRQKLFRGKALKAFADAASGLNAVNYINDAPEDFSKAIFGLLINFLITNNLLDIKLVARVSATEQETLREWAKGNISISQHDMHQVISSLARNAELESYDLLKI